MRILLLSVCLSITTAFGQLQHGINLDTGLDKVGWSLNPAYNLKLKHYQLDAGLRFMLRDQVFETRNPGIFLRYGYYGGQDPESRIWIGTSITTAWHTERKTTTRLFLLDVKAGVSIEVRFLQNFGWYLKPAIGFTSNYSSTWDTVEQKAFTYLNYELSSGIKYHFPARNSD